MRLAFSTNAFTRHSLSYALERIRAAGYSGVEILADVPHAYPGTLNSALIFEIARDIERLRLKVSNINANCSFGYFRDPPPEAFFEPSLISPDHEYRKDRLRMIGKAMELA
jgi:sugar phosphate isomerase/epimerase